MFLNQDDFNVKNDDLNYTNLQLKDNDSEFKARLFAFKWAKINLNKKNLKPYTVSHDEEEDLEENWKGYSVLLLNKSGYNKVLKVCFPKQLEDNFALVMSFGNQCNSKIKQINQYRIVDTKNQSTNKKTQKKEEPKKKKIVKYKYSKKTGKFHRLSKNKLRKLQKEKEYDNILKEFKLDDDSFDNKPPKSMSKDMMLKIKKEQNNNQNSDNTKIDEIEDLK